LELLSSASERLELVSVALEELCLLLVLLVEVLDCELEVLLELMKVVSS